MTDTQANDLKSVLQRYFRSIRDAVTWKLEGLGEHDLRRPLTPTGTNLLGVVKHLAGVEAGYFGDCLGRPVADMPDWYAALVAQELEDNGDMWATPEESSEEILALYRRVGEHSDAVVDELGLDATGTVPWWGERGRDVPLHLLLVHVIAETNRHAGHLDIVRELIDESTGLRDGVSNLPDGDARWWADYRARVQAAADEFA